MTQKFHLAVLSVICVVFSATASAQTGTVTINVKTGGWGDQASVSNGLAWGIVVDSDGNELNGSFSGTFLGDLAATLEGFSLPATADFSTPVLLFDEYYFARARGNTANSGPPGGDQDGYMNDLGLFLDSPVGAGDDYGLVWFSVDSGSLSVGDHFGFQDLGELPSGGSTVTPDVTPGLATQQVTSSGDSDPDDDQTSSWYSSSVDLGSGWRWFEWLGFFNVDQAPWIYHQQHGWLFPFADGPESVYFWDSEMGEAGSILWTSENVYPSLYRFSDGRWIWYQKGSESPRWFVDLVSGVWEQH